MKKLVALLALFAAVSFAFAVEAAKATEQKSDAAKKDATKPVAKK